MINLPITGLVHVTGEPDTGKTTLTLTTGAPPGAVAFFDDDLKTQAIADALDADGKPFGFFMNVTREFAALGTKGPAALHDLVISKLEALPDSKHQVLVFDNWTRMEAAIRAHSLAIMPQISDLTPGQVRSMSQLTWPYTYNYYAQVLDLMLAKAPLVLITTHIREQYIGNQKTGKLEPRGQRPLTEKASLRLWLRHNPDGPQPVGLVFKRLFKMELTGEGLKPVHVLPRRIKPCTWERVRHYTPGAAPNATPTDKTDSTHFAIE